MLDYLIWPVHCWKLFFSVVYNTSWHFGSFPINHFPSVPKSWGKMVFAKNITFHHGNWFFCTVVYNTSWHFDSFPINHFAQFQRVEEKWLLPKAWLLIMVEKKIKVLIGVLAVYPMYGSWYLARGSGGYVLVVLMNMMIMIHLISGSSILW